MTVGLLGDDLGLFTEAGVLSGLTHMFGAIVVLCQGMGPQEGEGVICCKRPKIKDRGVQPGEEAVWPFVGMDGMLDGAPLCVCPRGYRLSWFFVTDQGWLFASLVVNYFSW